MASPKSGTATCAFAHCTAGRGTRHRCREMAVELPLARLAAGPPATQRVWNRGIAAGKNRGLERRAAAAPAAETARRLVSAAWRSGPGKRVSSHLAALHCAAELDARPGRSRLWRDPVHGTHVSFKRRGGSTKPPSRRQQCFAGGCFRAHCPVHCQWTAARPNSLAQPCSALCCM